MAVGTIKLFDKEKRCGCVQDDGDSRVYFFHRGCIEPNYLSRKGDRVTFSVRTNPRGSGAEAYNFHVLHAASQRSVTEAEPCEPVEEN